MNFPDKFHLTPEQSLFLAKKKWDENVYCGMKMENRAVTFPQTRTILKESISRMFNWMTFRLSLI